MSFTIGNAELLSIRYHRVPFAEGVLFGVREAHKDCLYIHLFLKILIVDREITQTDGCRKWRARKEGRRSVIN